MFADMSALFESSTGARGCPKEGQTKPPQENRLCSIIMAVKMAGVKGLQRRKTTWLFRRFQHLLAINGCFASHSSTGEQENKFFLRSQIAFAF